MEINFYNLFIEQHTSSSNTAKFCVKRQLLKYRKRPIMSLA